MADELRIRLDAELKRPGRGGLARAFKSHERALKEYMVATRAVDEIVKRPEYDGLEEAMRAASAGDAAAAEAVAQKVIQGEDVDTDAAREVFDRLPALGRAFGGPGGPELLAAFERQGKSIAAFRSASLVLNRELGRPEFGKVARLLAELRRVTEEEVGRAAAQASGPEVSAAPGAEAC